MAYYPLSQVKTNLYTNGGEFVFNVNDPFQTYSGYYWKTSDGKYFTGKTPQDTPNSEIFLKLALDYNKYPDVATNPTINYITVNGGAEVNGGENIAGGDPTILSYLALKNIPSDSIQIVPTYNPTNPTQQDYQVGEFRRYFCKKTNENIYIEINLEVASLLFNKDPQILWQLYFSFNIPWTLTGDKATVATTNRNIVLQTEKDLRLPRFNDYIKNDYTKYYK
jgi:hypothetical protein